MYASVIVVIVRLRVLNVVCLGVAIATTVKCVGPQGQQYDKQQ